MANIVWDGETTDEPTTGTNWAGDAEPGATDIAIIPAYDDDPDSTSTGAANTILGSAAFPSASN
ncbi:unnamed protein product, partial [marine sediment metagenome]